MPPRCKPETELSRSDACDSSSTIGKQSQYWNNAPSSPVFQARAIQASLNEEVLRENLSN